MKTFEGYSKEKFTNNYVLLAGGGTKPITDFILSGAIPSLTPDYLEAGSLKVNGNATFVNPITGDILGNAATATIAAPSANSNYYVQYGGNDTNLGSGSPAATAKTYWDAAHLHGGAKLYYNSAGEEYNLLFAPHPTSYDYGTILKWTYGNRYMYMLRRAGGFWQSDDWEKMYAGYADSAGNADTVDSCHASDFVSKKVNAKFYPFIGQKHGSMWYKVTLPASGNNTPNTQWHMIAFEVVFGGPYSNGPSGTLKLAYYFVQAANAGAYTASNVYGVCVGTKTTSTSVTVKYNISNPMVVYIKCGASIYSSMAIENLTVNDNGSNYDFLNTTIETCSDPGDDVPTVVPITYLNETSYSGAVTNTYNLVGRNTSGTNYSATSGNLIFAEWNTYNDNRWLLKATGYECRVAYAASAGSVDWANTGHPSWIGSSKPSYTASEVGALPISGGTLTGLLTTNTGNNTGIKIGDTYVTAIGGNLILQNNTALRFGGSGWDWDVWAGLKYAPSSKTIYLGIGEKTDFTANNYQYGGKFVLTGISTIEINEPNQYQRSVTIETLGTSDDQSSGLKVNLVDGYIQTLGATNSDPILQIIRGTSETRISTGASTFAGTVTATGFYQSSDINLKTNIKAISSSFKEFNWKNNGEKSYGLIAQELEKDYPELVHIKEDGYKTVDYTAALCMIIAKLENRIAELETKIK